MIVMESNTQNADIEAVVARTASIGCESHAAFEDLMVVIRKLADAMGVTVT